MPPNPTSGGSAWRWVVALVARALWLATLVSAVAGLANYLVIRFTSTDASVFQVDAVATDAMAMPVVLYVLAAAWDRLTGRRPPPPDRVVQSRQ
jgi:hypothetical protein